MPFSTIVNFPTTVPIAEGRVAELAQKHTFPTSSELMRMRGVAEVAHAQLVVYRWLDAHNALISFRRNHERNRAEAETEADRFWYRTPNSVTIVIAICRSYLAGEAVSINAVARLTGLSRPTVQNICHDAINAGFLNVALEPDERTQTFINERVIEVVTQPEFKAFARALCAWETMSMQPMPLSD